MMNNIMLVLFCLCNAVAICLFAWLSIILMEIVLCKDAKQVNTAKLLSRKLSIRLRLLRRNLGNNFYVATIFVWISSYGFIIEGLSRMSGGSVPYSGMFLVVAKICAGWGLILLYKYWGYESRLFSTDK